VRNSDDAHATELCLFFASGDHQAGFDCLGAAKWHAGFVRRSAAFDWQQ